MKPLSPRAKVGVVAAGVVGALVVAWCAVALRVRFTHGPDAQASAGMAAFSDLLLGLGVFGLLALVLAALGFYWLRSVAWFWTWLTLGALAFAATGFLALGARVWASPSSNPWLLFAEVRIGIMVFSTPVLLVCALFAPQVRHRWLLLAAAFSEGAIFLGVVLVKIFLPSFRGF